ncbi:MAG: mannose-1-phosphate guanylyltransferase/mannose-6-phosphate isomerase, partial [Pseudohongiellaceae bacterium]
GGSGSRLWPLSRAQLPKQFIELPGQKGSLFQATLTRLATLAGLGDPIVVCNAEHRFLVAEQLRQLGQDRASILLEPVGRNTAPAVAMAAHWAMEHDPDAQLLVLPADHWITEPQALIAAVEQGRTLTADGSLVTFGIVPGAPETGYGYIEKGEAIAGGDARRVARFVEKPDRATAERYLASGDYLWNSGMFLFTAERFLAELQRHADDISRACGDAFGHLQRGSDFITIPDTEFAACRADSIDYAVMEKTDAAVVLPLEAGWSDLGTWDAIWSARAADSQGNVLSGDVLTEAVHNSYIQAGSRLVAAVGLDGVVVVETPDAVLVADKGQAQAVKAIVERLHKDGRPEADCPNVVRRPWGTYQTLAIDDGWQVKHIVVNPGAALSLQLHHRRAEHWTVIKGSARVIVGDEELTLAVNESVHIPLGNKHRLANDGPGLVEIIEVQVGDYLGEDDIVRFDDRYGRVE